MQKVCFVGITDKEGKEPFDSSTKSGMILDLIISKLPFTCKKMNYVSYPPIDENGKLRYPTKEELALSFSSFYERLKRWNPDLIVVCGTMIFRELQKKNIDYPFLKIYHPSYIFVYQRKELNSYIEETVKQIKSYFEIGEV